MSEIWWVAMTNTPTQVSHHHIPVYKSECVSVQIYHQRSVHTLTHNNLPSQQSKSPELGMAGVTQLFSRKQMRVSNDRLELRVPDRESQTRQRGRFLEPSQSGPVCTYQDPPAIQAHIQTIVRRRIPFVLADLVADD